MRPLNKRKLSPLDGTRLRPRARTFLVWDTLERGLALQVHLARLVALLVWKLPASSIDAPFIS
jgi:hypothetical protein